MSKEPNDYLKPIFSIPLYTLLRNTQLSLFEVECYKNMQIRN